MVGGDFAGGDGVEEGDGVGRAAAESGEGVAALGGGEVAVDARGSLAGSRASSNVGEAAEGVGAEVGCGEQREQHRATSWAIATLSERANRLPAVVDRRLCRRGSVPASDSAAARRRR